MLPGVNLLVSALPTGVSDLIEVTSASAAANPDLASITFPMTTSGLSVSASATGVATAVDSSGDVVYEAAPPQMWDSAGQQAPGPSAPSAVRAPLASSVSPAAAASAGVVPGDHSAVMDLQASDSSLSLTPAPAVLSGRSVVYPVFIDPQWNSTTGKGATWSDIGTDTSGATGGDWEFSSSQFGGIRSGVACDASDCSTTKFTARSFLNFPAPSDPTFVGAEYVDAQLQLLEKWSWTCSPPNGPTTVDMYNTKNNVATTAASTAAMTWSTQPAEGKLQDNWAGEFGDTCPTGEVKLSAQQAAQQAANNNWDHVTLELAATGPDETALNQYSWKRFDASSMTLDFYWRNPPDVPTGIGTQGVFDAQTGQTATHCSDLPFAPDYVNTQSPTWQASISDRDAGSPNDGGGADYNGEFLWDNVTTGASSGTLADAGNPHASGFQFTASRTGTPGDMYEWNAFGQALQSDPFNAGAGALNGPFAQTCLFTIDTNFPEAPKVTTSWTTANPVGTPGQFTFSEPGGYSSSELGINDVVGYLYGIDNSQPSIYVPATEIGGTATVTITPFTPFAIDLYVQAVGAGGNVSNWGGASSNGLTEYQIFSGLPTGNVAQLGYWQLNNQPSSNVGDDSVNLSLLSGAGFGCGSVKNPPLYTCSLDLAQTAGSTEHAATRPLVGADGNFGVSAWVNPAGCLQVYCAVMSQGAVNVSVFTLGYQSSGHAEWKDGSGTTHSTQCPCYLVSVPKSDSAAASYQYAPNTASTNWYLAAASVLPGEGPGNWTQLTAVMNATNGSLSLYVNGGDGAQQPGDHTAGDEIPAASVSFSPWSSAPDTGFFRFGADWTAATGNGDFFDGSISSACVFYGLLTNGNQESPNDIQSLYDKGSGDGCALPLPTN